MPARTDIDHAARLIRAGRLVAFPTETVYGLGANALDPDAVARIFAVKGRPSTSPLIVHVASLEMAKSLVAEWPETAERLARRFWPGPLTLVLPARSHLVSGRPEPIVPTIVTAGLPTVGLRMPAHPVARSLLEAAGVPLAAPSANRFTQLSPTTAQHVRSGIGADVDYILDGGACQIGIESTVLSLSESKPILLRPGGISRADIEATIGPVARMSEPGTAAHPSPGMHPRHYSPRTPLFLVRDGMVPETGAGIYLQQAKSPSRPDVLVLHMPASAHDYASVLYSKLHEADTAAADWIAVDLPPETAEWEAIHDRLQRAQTK